ncbi:hypothetical protein TWF106_000968 [Orbilia oligospora]|uniref:Extracellular serine-rich protein n=1 Tax=Orbilia oligospora TaxID=2813651 RepID=A0A6G1M4K1_ORBOL|nr:hypothetical protein TWF788_011110 [Orbilia oligospora]KAF3205982.1 hypothetical protein TWF106_000968 [Orbilia oligospora]KAF3216536.1 hypothetical protein TWF191_009022 [Orbilia oligospora]KAF3223561.1 hypothetical protein TWF679_000008 [Orbilia oligospora]KAF3245042.1 hypothetical protein TWF192_007565 [Orbilia oligospora]
MFFSKAVIAFAALASFVSAQSDQVKVHVVQALNKDGKPVFEPAEIQAAVGDLIQFQFHPLNHSVVRASFADPCIPIEDSPAGNGTVGFFSGFMPVAESAEVMPTFTIRVENDKPIWFYCSQGRHCQAGMVGAINPTAERTLADFTSRAAQAEANLSPGQNSAGNGGSSSSVLPTPTNPPSTPTTLETSAARTTTGAAPSITDLVPPNSAARLGSSMSLVLAAIAASFFLL